MNKPDIHLSTHTRHILTERLPANYPSSFRYAASGNLGSSTYLRHCDLIGRVHEMRRVVIDVGHAHNKRNVALLIRLANGAGNLWGRRTGRSVRLGGLEK